MPTTPILRVKRRAYALFAVMLLLDLGCECTEDLTIRSGRFCATDSWESLDTAIQRKPIVSVTTEQVTIEYTLANLAYVVDYDVTMMKVHTGSCPDKTESYVLKRRRLQRIDGGAVPATEDRFWSQDAELRAEPYGVGVGINALYIGATPYYLSGKDYCPQLANEDAEDSGVEDDAGSIGACGPGEADASP